MESLSIQKRPKLKNPCLVVAWPGMGEVAFKAAQYLIEQLNATEFASLAPDEFFYLTGSLVQDGILSLPELPYGKFYFWKNPENKPSNKKNARDLIIFLSNAQPDLARAEKYCQLILTLAKDYNVKTVVSMASMPQAIDHTQDPAVWFTGTSKEVNDSFKGYQMNLLSQGQISGMNGLFLGMAKVKGFAGLCILGEIPLYTLQIENPKAAFVVLEALTRILGIKLDFGPLVDQAHLMEGEINKLLDYLKAGAAGQPSPIGEEEIEKIKKSLSQLTRLPVSVKEKIDKLFVQSQTDLSKANELKAELDKWNVYKEYEDRFLDLFKKSKEKDN
ncbi:MAG: PAC2 family protein [Candidatus Omnitrophica bacterium]|nr:PAC2 family protein [Candidatus Omnitrophota bacterium]